MTTMRKNFYIDEQPAQEWDLSDFWSDQSVPGEQNAQNSAQERSHRCRLWQYCFQRQITASELLAMGDELGLDGVSLERYITFYWAILGLAGLNELRAQFRLPPVGAEQVFDRLLGMRKAQAMLFSYFSGGLTTGDLQTGFWQRLLESVRRQLKSCFVSRDDLTVILRFVLYGIAKRFFVKLDDRFEWAPNSAAGMVLRDRWDDNLQNTIDAANSTGAVNAGMIFLLPAVSWLVDGVPNLVRSASLPSLPPQSLSLSIPSSSSASLTATCPVILVDFLTFAAYYGARRCFAQAWLKTYAKDRALFAQDYGSVAIMGGDLAIFQQVAQQPIAFKKCCLTAIRLGRQQLLDYLVAHSPYRWQDLPVEWCVVGFTHVNQLFIDKIWPEMGETWQLSVIQAVLERCYRRLHDEIKLTPRAQLGRDSGVFSLLAQCGEMLSVYTRAEWLPELVRNFTESASIAAASRGNFWQLLAAFDAGAWISRLSDSAFTTSLLESGANLLALYAQLNAQDGLGCSALQLAAYLQHEQAAAQLLRMPKIELDVPDVRQQTARQLITSNGWEELLGARSGEIFADGEKSGELNAERDRAAINYITDRKRVRRQSMRSRGSGMFDW